MFKTFIFSIIAMLAISMTSCKKDDNKVRPWSKIVLNSKPVTTKSADVNHLSPKEIVKQTSSIRFINFDVSVLPSGMLFRGFAEQMRDTINMRLLMESTDVIREDGSLKRDFIDGKDFLFTKDTKVGVIQPYDTIAYIPNAVIQEAKRIILDAYARGDYNTCYKTMEEAYVFIPITGKEYRELKAQGLN